MVRTDRRARRRESSLASDSFWRFFGGFAKDAYGAAAPSSSDEPRPSLGPARLTEIHIAIARIRGGSDGSDSQRAHPPCPMPATGWRPGLAFRKRRGIGRRKPTMRRHGLRERDAARRSHLSW